MVTKQQQLEWLAINIDDFFGMDVAHMSSSWLGRMRMIGESLYHAITRQEWQQERDKMQKPIEISIKGGLVDSAFAAQPVQDNSWHERGELPPVGCECEYVTGISRHPVKIQGVGHVDGYPVAFFAMNDSWVTATAEFFRPLRTEREKAIDAACKAIGGVIGGRLIIERLYDAGLLK